ncbi:MAG: PSD1 and planctomycete cytochrome C domain-containing protein [Gemmataceae bacterium]
MDRLLLALILSPLLATMALAGPPSKEVDFFETKIRPILVEKCQQCHGEKKQSGGLRLDTFEGFTAGSDEGPVVVKGKPRESKLFKSVKREGEHPMPPQTPLPAEQVALLSEWISQGAVYPPSEKKAAAVVKPDPKQHWAYRPLVEPAVPADRGRTEIDRYVNARLKDASLSMNTPTDRRTLLRRLSFDLVGLPPTYEEIAQFESDTDPKAVEKVVDRLLASPHFGERWARHWMDVARYSDSKGYVFTEDRNFPYSYTYRDYLIKAFNGDKPYDQFIMEQLAADRMDRKGDDKSLAAMGFLTLGRRFLNNNHDIIDDRIDVAMRGLMGLTVGCSRCHDHKYDPIPIADYYSLYGVFAGSREPSEPPLLEPKSKENLAFEAELARKEKAAQDYADKMYAEALAPFRTAESARDYLLAIHDSKGKSPKEVDQILMDRKLRQAIFDRWKARLAQSEKNRDPIFSAWFAASTLATDDVPLLGPSLAVSLVEAKVAVDPRILSAFEANPPRSMRDVATVYGQALFAATLSKEASAKPLASLLIGPDAAPSLPIPTEADKVVPIAVKKGYRTLRNDAQKFRALSPDAPARAMSLIDNDSPYQPVVFLRGNPNNRGPQVPLQFLGFLSGPNRKPFTNGSGRLDLARAIADPKNPLTARVYVNRVWAHLFEEGLVRSPSDFGMRTDPPSHPALLDWLAANFIKHQWSTKWLIRQIVLSEAYQQQSAPTEHASLKDPENRLLSHQHLKRHDFETLRDSMLFAAGTLDLSMHGRSVDLFSQPFTTRRTLYGTVDRQNLPSALRAFDFALPDQHTPQRFRTTVPQQALYLMNAPFVVAQAKALADRPEVKQAQGIEGQVNSLFKLTLGRLPSTEELSAGVQFLTPQTGWSFLRPKSAASKLEEFAQVLLWSNEFAFAE